MTASRGGNWDPRRQPKAVLTLIALIAALGAFLVMRARGTATVAESESSRDTMCLVARLGMSCRD
jgi:hypothetical protein